MFKKFLENCKSYYVAHIGFALAATAAIANHVGALTSIFHGNAALAQEVAGYCEVAGLLAAYAPKAIEHAQAISAGSN